MNCVFLFLESSLFITHQSSSFVKSSLWFASLPIVVISKPLICPSLIWRDWSQDCGHFLILAVRKKLLLCEPVQKNMLIKKLEDEVLDMRINLLPTMENVKLTDRDGQPFLMAVELRKFGEKMYVFMSDGNQLGSSVLAKDAVFYLEKIAKNLHLDTKNTIFYRHIFQEQMGSLFGRFRVDWENTESLSYQFKMLTNIEDLESIKHVIDGSESISLASLAASQKNAA